VNSRPANGDAEPGPGELRLELAVYGMHCQGCATALRLGLAEVDGVRQILGRCARPTGSRRRPSQVLQEPAVRAKVEELGYRLTPRTPLLQRWRRGRPTAQ
jgi:cation transport ATPase